MVVYAWEPMDCGLFFLTQRDDAWSGRAVYDSALATDARHFRSIRLFSEKVMPNVA